MKLFKLCVFLFLFTLSSFGQKEQLDLFFDKTDVFLAMNVSEGLVNYESIYENTVALEDLIHLK